DGKKVIITETSVRRDIHLEDAEGTECLPTATIFEELTRMGYEKLTQKLTFYKAFFSPQWKFLIHTILQYLSAKTTAWNEFSSTMAFAIICLATKQKFNFSKYIFDNMLKNLEGGVKFLMYPRFVQVFVNQQRGDMSHHKKIFVTTSCTKKVFGNMKREEKDFSRRVTILFQTMMVQAQEEMGEEPIANEAANKENVPTHSNDPLLSAKTAQDSEIANLKKRVKKLERRNKSRTLGLKRLMKVGSARRLESSDEASLGRNDKEMFDKGILDGEEVFAEQDVVEKKVSATDTVTNAGEVVTTVSVKFSTAEVTIDSATTTTVDELTLASELNKIKAAKPKVRGVMIQEPSEFTTTTTTTTPAASKPSQDKGKAKMTEPEKPLKKKDQIMYDQEVALNLQAQLQAELEEEERLAR
ncbi:hypothetical protein Tco_0957491, partial [Tanacetum coccineum]